MSILSQSSSNYAKAFLKATKTWAKPSAQSNWFASLDTGPLETSTQCLPCIRAIASGEYVNGGEAAPEFPAGHLGGVDCRGNDPAPCKGFCEEGNEANRNPRDCIYPSTATDLWYITRALVVCQNVISNYCNDGMHAGVYDVAVQWNNDFIEYIQLHKEDFAEQVVE